MDKILNNEFITNIDKKFLWQYFTGNISLFRYYQNIYLNNIGKYFRGTIIEIGGLPTVNNKQYFPNAKNYILTNITGDVQSILDVTNMDGIDDNSIDSIVCISVLEHIFEINKAIREIERVLKPGGNLVITTPFLFPYHDNVDYYRFSKDYYLNCFSSIELKNITKLGGAISTIVNILQRPCGKLSLRYTFYKTIGFIIAIFGIFIDTSDNYPLGYAIYGEKPE